LKKPVTRNHYAKPAYHRRLRDIANLQRLLKWREIMPEASQVTVRLLPDEIAWSTTVRSHHTSEVELDLPAEASGLKRGALVEIESLDTLSLGKVVLREETSILVVVEHTVDLHKLARIQEIWHAPQA
jgi:hypothetical protein